MTQLQFLSASGRRSQQCSTQRSPTYLLSEQLVVDPEPIQGADIFPQLQVALSQLFDVLAGFGQDSAFTLKRHQDGCVPSER